MRLKICFRLLSYLLIAAALVLSACSTEIQHGLNEREANIMVAILRKAGIQAEKVQEKGRKPVFTVQVPSKQAVRAFEILKARELPQRSRQGVVELFGKSSLVPTSTEEHMKMVHAISAEVERTLEQMDGVLAARVHMVLPKEGRFKDEPGSTPEARASVFIKILPGFAPPTPPEIQRLVAGAAAGLKPEAISVMVQTGAKLSSPPEPAQQMGPYWLKVVAVVGCGAALVLVMVLIALGLRYKKLKQKNESIISDNTGSGLRMVDRTGSSSYRP